jgi:pimeloyl-ACP methyl ester carboxylesterase
MKTNVKKILMLSGSYCFCLFLLLAVFGLEKSKQTDKDVNITLSDSNSGIVKKYVDIGDAYIYYEMAGQGAPVILIHAHSMDRRMWDPQFTELAKHYKVVRYDMRGYGKTDVPVEGEKFLHIEDLHKLMYFLGIPKAHLVGLSLGSFVAVDSLVLYPEQTLSITVASGGIRDTIVPDDATAEQRAAAQAKALQEKVASIEAVRKQGIDVFKKEWLEHMVRDCGPYGEKIRPKLWEMINDWSAWQVLHVEPRWELDPPVAVQIKTKKPDIPVLVLIGKDDTKGSHNSSEYLARIAPKARKKYLKNAGHFSNMETPAAFNKALMDFLASVENNSAAAKAKN